MSNDKPVIAYLPLTAFSSLNIHEVDYTEDKVLISISTNNTQSKKSWCKIRYTSKGAYFTSRDTRYYLSEFLRT